MTTSTNKKINYIPTELNYINYSFNKLKQHTTAINISRQLIILLLLWNTALTGFIMYNNMTANQPEELEVIENIQDFEPLTIDEFEVIGD